jgi:cytosol alanyl aminopeptidase
VIWARAASAFGLAVVASCNGLSGNGGKGVVIAQGGRQSSVRSPEEEGGPPSPRDDGRLPITVKPLRYALSLRIDPARPRFSGVARIQVDVPAPTSYVVMHARAMTIARVLARFGSREVWAGVAERTGHGGVEPDELVLSFAPPLPSGTAEIEITYDAPFAADLAGLYRVEEGGRTYAYTQFQVADARRAFPCFDEPAFKTPYDVSIAAPSTTMALSNMPELRSAAAPDAMIVHQFATSPPLPTYLVAFAVGDFDVVEWQKDPFPVRAIATKGRADLTGIALEAATALVSKLSDYFDFPYPFAKLDLVAVPDFAAGAMENPGLITFRDTLLLLDPRHATTSARRAQAEVIAHELAHQWLGDLVTMSWWDDLWLNEGFATWAEAKIVDAWRPSFGATFEQIAGMQAVMDTDALKSARAVREPVRSTSEAEEAFDGITYDKGAAVLRMIEGWLGPDVFRRGVQRYVHQNAWKTARAADLFAALEFVSTERIGPLANAFLDQPGVPEALVSWNCAGGLGRVELSESEWRPLGDGEQPGRRGWTLPVCVEADTRRGKGCFTLARDPIVRDLGPGCPTWVYPNTGGVGYYRFAVDAARLVALARASRALSPIDRLGLVSNAWAEVRQGVVGASVLFDLLPAFDAENNRYVVDQIGAVLQGIGHALVDEDVRGAFQRWVVARLGARKTALGWDDKAPAGPGRGPSVEGTVSGTPASQRDDDRALERRTVLWLMGELANDGETLDEAEAYAERWLQDPSGVPSDTAAVAVPLASKRAGPARLFQLRSAAINAKTPEDRALAIRAMAMFDDPELLRRAFDLALGGELKLSELRTLFGSANGHRAARPVLYAWEKENWAKLRAHLPGTFGRGVLVDVVSTICVQANRDDAQRFFTAATEGLEGFKRRLEQALEAADLCIALRDHAAAEVAQYLKRKPRAD